MITHNNFDWSITDRKLCIFIPNFGRGGYIRSLLSQFTTNADPSKDYSIVIGNDGIHEDFSDLKDKNIHYFTLNRETPSISRNGCFIRNFFIKRCKSENIFQKDPETFIFGDNNSDWIFNLLNIDTKFYRPFYTLDCGQELSNQLIQNIDKYKQVLDYNKSEFASCTPKISHRVHWGYMASTQLLQELHGYDEKFINYGYEDTDIYFRLLMKTHITIDANLYVMHMHHMIDPNIYEEVDMMRFIYQNIDPNIIIRNGEDWGNG